MAIDDELHGLDPYDLIAAEATRIEAFARTLDAAGWAEPSGCAAWSRRDLLAHLVADEAYFHAGLEFRVGEMIAEQLERGVTSLDGFNQLGVEDRREADTAMLLDEWVTADRATRDGMRALDGGNVDTSVGAYPARWQAFHIASELATHADDLGVPVTEAEQSARTDWRARFSSFALQETKPEVSVTRVGDGYDVTAPDRPVLSLDAAAFVDAVAGRPAGSSTLDADTLALLSTMP